MVIRIKPYDLYKLVCFSFASLALFGLTGCQAWYGGGYPLQSNSRVPPPGTGSFQVPSTYYNNAGGSVSQVVQGVPTNSVAASAMNAPQASQGMAATNMTQALPSTSQNARGFPVANPMNNAVQPAGYVAPSAGGQMPASGSASINFSDTNEAPSLNWQP